jgi:pimeloyl-ACP methyl ester carboxylesterase
MKKLNLLILLQLLLLSGCAYNDFSIRRDVALSFDSVRIAYDVNGEGNTALIFVHGWSCDARYWQKQVPVFAQNYQVITVDLAGHGHSSFDREEFTMMSFAKDIEAIIKKENIDRAILIGHSMGGAVIAESAKLNPEGVIGIIGVDTLQNITLRTPQNEIDEMLKPFEADFKIATYNFVLSMFPTGADEKLKNWIKEDMSSAPKEVALSAFRNYLGQYANGEAKTVFEHITIPVVSINAKLWPTAAEQNKKYIRDYQLFYVEGTGHFPMLEKPEEFNRLLENAIEMIEAESNKMFN